MSLSPAVSTFLFEAVNFLVLAAALSWLLLKPLRRALDAEREARAKLEKEATARLEEAERVRAEVQAQRTALAQELERLKAEGKAAAEAQAQALLDEAKVRADADRASLKRQLELQERSWREAMVGEGASVAAQAVLRLLEWLGGPELELALTRVACRELQALPVGGLGQVVVESSSPLSAEAHALVDSALAGAAGVQYRTVPTLGAGLRLITGAGLVDASASGMAAYARQVLATAPRAAAQSPEPAHG